MEEWNGREDTGCDEIDLFLQFLCSDWLIEHGRSETVLECLDHWISRLNFRPGYLNKFQFLMMHISTTKDKIKSIVFWWAWWVCLPLLTFSEQSSCIPVRVWQIELVWICRKASAPLQLRGNKPVTLAWSIKLVPIYIYVFTEMQVTHRMAVRRRSRCNGFYWSQRSITESVKRR